MFLLEVCFSPLQPCTEVLFIDIFHEYNQTLTPVLLEMMQTLQGKLYFEIFLLSHLINIQIVCMPSMYSAS